MHILFVCLGNICRSPVADGLLRRKVEENKLDVTVDSAGTISTHAGEAPDPRMIETAKQRGTEISFLRARQFTRSDFDKFDLIYVMDESNLSDVLSMARSEKEQKKVQLVLDLVQIGSEVPDPYYGGQQGFNHVYDLLDEATNRIIENIKSANS